MSAPLAENVVSIPSLYSDLSQSRRLSALVLDGVGRRDLYF